MPKRAKPKEKRAVRGTGSIKWNKRRKCYVWRIPVGVYPNKRTKYAEASGKTQAECVEAAKLIKPPDPNAITVREWAERWTAGLAARRSGTKAVYTHSINSRIVPAMGHLRLKDLTVSTVLAEATKWLGSKKEGKLAPQTVNLTLDRATTMFAAAIRDRLVSDNPFALCPRFESQAKPIDPFTPAELRQLIAARDRLSCAPLFAFLAATGCRVGEGAALDVADYDRPSGRISITRTYSPAHGLGPPKSKYSRRTLDLPPQARTIVEEAIGTRTGGVLFGTAAGRRLNYSDLWHRFNRLLKLLGMRRRSIHATRHGVATAQVAAGVPLGDVAKWLGDTVDMIVKTYLHPTSYDVSAAMGRILSVDV